VNDHGNGAAETPPEPGSNVAGTPANPDERPEPDNPAGALSPGSGAVPSSGTAPGHEVAPPAPSGPSASAGEHSDTDATPANAESAATGHPPSPDAVSGEMPEATAPHAAPAAATIGETPPPEPARGTSPPEASGDTTSPAEASGNTAFPAEESGNTTSPAESAPETVRQPTASGDEPSSPEHSPRPTPVELSPADLDDLADPILPADQPGPAPHRGAPEPGGIAARAYGSEDLLPRHAADPEVPPGKARRSPWNRGRDRLIAAGIAVLVAVGITVVAAGSDNLHTSRALADPPRALPAPPSAVPGAMTQLWQAPSSATPIPVAQSDTVTTADGGEVAGRDPLTGQIRWHYTRENLQLCTVDTAWGRVNAVYHKSMGCSEVTQLDPATGRITAQRNGDAELGTQLIDDGSHVTTTGKHLLDTWRDDLVKSMEYGKVPFLVNANKQPRADCTFGTVAAANDKIGVIERCPGDRTDRLTVYKATAEHEDEPQVVYTAVLAGTHARVLAMSGDLVGVLLPEQQTYVVYGADGSQKATYPMDLPADDLKNDPPGGTEPTTRTAAALYWYSGSKTVALSRDDLSPRWTLDRTLGPGIVFAGQLVVPIPGGLAVLNETTGATLRTVSVNRGSYTGPIRLTPLGPVLLEQRGPNVAALR